MGAKQTRERLVRQWRILDALQGKRRGMKAAQLMEELGVSRATLYRDLQVLLESPLPIVKEVVTGEARYALAHHGFPSLVPSGRQVAALYLARRMLEPLDGSAVVDEMDSLLRRFMRADPHPKPITLAEAKRSSNRDHIRALERAIEERRRLRLRYLGVADRQAADRVVEPVELRLHEGHLYLMALDLERDGFRTFKVSRMQAVTVLDESARSHPEYDADEVFRHSMGIWSGEPIDVEIRLSAMGHRFLMDWPLATNQEVVALDDGGAIVRATVAGDIEVLRWVTRWGRHAEVLAPEGLREAVRDELGAALGFYGGERVQKVSQES